jgi:hypothetical protein
MDPEQEQEYLKRIDEQHLSIEDLKGINFWFFRDVSCRIKGKHQGQGHSIELCVPWISCLLELFFDRKNCKKSIHVIKISVSIFRKLNNLLSHWCGQSGKRKSLSKSVYRSGWWINPRDKSGLHGPLETPEVGSIPRRSKHPSSTMHTHCESCFHNGTESACSQDQCIKNSLTIGGKRSC